MIVAHLTWNSRMSCEVRLPYGRVVGESEQARADFVCHIRGRARGTPAESGDDELLELLERLLRDADPEPVEQELALVDPRDLCAGATVSPKKRIEHDRTIES